MKDILKFVLLFVIVLITLHGFVEVKDMVRNATGKDQSRSPDADTNLSNVEPRNEYPEYVDTIRRNIPDNATSDELPTYEDIYESILPHLDRLQAYEAERLTKVCQLSDPKDWKLSGEIQNTLTKEYNISTALTSDYRNLLFRYREELAPQRAELNSIIDTQCAGKEAPIYYPDEPVIAKPFLTITPDE